MVREQLDPADLLEEALVNFKPGSRTGREVAETAMILAGIVPAHAPGELVTVAQDLVDNDTRIFSEEE